MARTSVNVDQRWCEGSLPAGPVVDATEGVAVGVAELGFRVGSGGAVMSEAERHCGSGPREER